VLPSLATRPGKLRARAGLIFNGRENIQVVAVADPDPVGRVKAAARAKALRQYANYREMLIRRSPNSFVSPRAGRTNIMRWRWRHCRQARTLHGEANHPDLVEADELISVSNRAGLRIAAATKCAWRRTSSPSSRRLIPG